MLEGNESDQAIPGAAGSDALLAASSVEVSGSGEGVKAAGRSQDRICGEGAPQLGEGSLRSGALGQIQIDPFREHHMRLLSQGPVHRGDSRCPARPRIVDPDRGVDEQHARYPAANDRPARASSPCAATSALGG